MATSARWVVVSGSCCHNDRWVGPYGIMIILDCLLMTMDARERNAGQVLDGTYITSISALPGTRLQHCSIHKGRLKGL